MSFVPKPREIESVVTLDGFKRYSYTIQKIVGWKEVWSIQDVDGWLLYSSSEHDQLVPVWPAKEYALLLCAGDWVKCQPAPISLDEFVMKWLPGMNRDKRKLVVFPLSTDVGVVSSPDQVFQDIKEARTQYID
jgi:hypothetical protein